MIEILIGILVIVSFITLQLRNLLAGVILLGVVSLLSTLVFFLLHAPDVALTEAAVGTGVGTVVFVWIVRKTERRDDT
jgi:energy-converting hydrogenase B subunit D